MCLLNYYKKNEKYKHLTYAERTMIETWYNSDKKSKKEIASLLHKSERTIRREINRGLVTIRNYDWTEGKEYSVRVAQDKYEYGMTSKGPALKLDSDIKLVEYIEKEIKSNKKSSEVVAVQLKNYGFDIKISGKTIRNSIKSGLIFENIEDGKIIYKKEYNNKNKEKRVSKMVPAEKSLNTCLTSSNMYCLTSDGILYSIDNNLKINKLADKIYDDIYKYNSELYVIGMKDNQNNLYKIKNDNIEEVDSNIASSSIKVANDKLFYLKAKDKNYDLYRYDGQKSILLCEKINKFYIIDKNIYLLKDYNEEDLTGSLYLYNEKEDKLLINKVTDLK